MKVLQFVADGAPGGGTNHVLQLLRGFRDACEPLLLTQRDSWLAQQASEDGVQVVTGDFFRSRLDPAAIRRVRTTICEHEPDIVHCHGGRAAFYRSFVAHTAPSVYTVHGFHFARKRRASRMAGWLAEFWSMRRMKRIIFVCDHDRDLARNTALLSTQQHQVIYNGIPVPTVSTREARLKSGFAVGFVGRMVPQKNPQLFVETVARLPDTDVVMVGGGELEPEVTQLVESHGLGNRFRMLGSLGHRDALEVLSRLDVLLMTPRWEGLPLLPLEAMFLGVPVVSTSCGGIPEFIQHRQTGMLAGQEDPGELAACIRELMDNETLRGTIVENAANMVRERFEQQVMLDQVAEVYRELSGFPIKRGDDSRVRTRETSTSPDS